MKKALIVQGGWEGHEPEESAEVFRTIGKGSAVIQLP